LVIIEIFVFLNIFGYIVNMTNKEKVDINCAIKKHRETIYFFEWEKDKLILYTPKGVQEIEKPTIKGITNWKF
jgi:hypothetical protein